MIPRLVAVTAAAAFALASAVAEANVSTTLMEHIRQSPVVVIAPATIAVTRPPEAEPVAPPLTLERGRLYWVRLTPRDEAAASAQVVEQVAAADPEAAASLRTFAGVVRVLANDGTELVIKPYVRAAKRLRFIPDAQEFVGSLAIGLASLGSAQGSQMLSAPFAFKVFETGQHVSVQQLSPPYALIDIATDAAARPPILHIAANFTDERLAATAPLVPTLRVGLDNQTLEGLGLQTATVTVDAVGGPTVPTGVVSLSAPGAVLDDDRLDLDSHGRAHTRLRGVLAGRITITATASGYDAGATSLGIVWPSYAIIPTLLGSLLGAAIRMSTRPRRDMTATRLAYGLICAAVIGELVFGLYDLVGLLSLLTPLHLDARVAGLVAFGAATVAGWNGIGALMPAEKASDRRSSGTIRVSGPAASCD